MIVIVSGAGGVGKGTVVARLLELEPNLWLSRSWTTRARRPGEAADAYVFVDREAFQDHIDADGFAEWTEFLGELYGTPTLDGLEAGAGDKDRDVLLEIELDGAQQIKRRYPDAVTILVVAPGRNVQAARLRARGDDEEHVQSRLAVGATEERLGRQIADYVVVNDDVDRAARQLADIIRGRQAGG
jgi:guanylate kinase